MDDRGRRPSSALLHHGEQQPAAWVEGGLRLGQNARLIAAAPDLLAAVSELLDSLDAIHPELEEELKASADNTTSKFGAGLIESYRRATAALKKANGGEA